MIIDTQPAASIIIDSQRSSALFTAHSMSLAIGDIEGWRVPDSLVHRLHNPGALVFAGQPGARPASGGYASFADDAAGWTAVERDILAKLQLGLSPAEVGAMWSAHPERYLELLKQDSRTAALVDPPR